MKENTKRLRAAICRLLGHEAATVRPCVEFDGAPSGVTIYIPFDTLPTVVTPHSLAVRTEMEPTQLHKLVRFVTRRRLPVDTWVCSGLDVVPLHTARLAEWLALIADDVGRARLVVDTDGLGIRAREHLRRGLVRRGCTVVTGPAHRGQADGAAREVT